MALRERRGKLEIGYRVTAPGWDMGRARYRPIDDHEHYWRNYFFWTNFGKLNLKINFQRKKKLSGLKPRLIPLTGQCNYH